VSGVITRTTVRKCPRCGGERDRTGQRLCLSCHAAYMRVWRKTHPLSIEHRQRHISRSIASVSKKRGRIIAQSCAVCGAAAEMHHVDYERPLDVTWLCRSCHLAWHEFWRATVLDIFSRWVVTACAEFRPVSYEKQTVSTRSLEMPV
jgi:hypothetical protein